MWSSTVCTCSYSSLDDIESCNEGQSCGQWFILGLYDSIAHFNDGSIASSEIFKTWKWCQVTTWWYKIRAAYRTSELQLKRRKIIRHCRKKKHYKNLDKEEPNHQAGGFWEWVNICFTYLMFCFIYMYYFLYSNRFNTNNKRHFLSNGNREEL